MKNKISKSIKLATLLIATYFLSSCMGYGSNMKKSDSKDESPVEEMRGLNLNSKLLQCPVCKEGALCLYKLSNQEQSIVLFCEECKLFWDNWSENDRLNKPMSRKGLAIKYKANDYKDLFEKEKAGWVTEEEAIKGPKWANILTYNYGVLYLTE
jgi:hypothetical protein